MATRIAHALLGAALSAHVLGVVRAPGRIP